ncbi:mechanosensitive ion channel domain-containing protein, partial [Acidisphaera rubrifaciens]|uniref:mechanosensitive ion channel domain-containing protein n=1 Tax=Acidisphaera rubrifaciens TaxID=50715 RepID=UPI000662095D
RVRSHYNRAFIRLLYGLRRVPFALLHFVLELIPIAGFALVAFGFEFFGLIRLDASHVVVRSAVTAFAVGGVMFAVIYTAFAPGRPALRPVLIGDDVAEVSAFWLRLMVVMGAWGFAGLNVAQTLGMPFYSAAAMSKLLVLAEHTALAVLIWRVRHDVARHLQPPRRIGGELYRLLAALGRAWWVVAIFIDYALWFVWAAQLKDGYVRLCTLLIETVAVAIGARLLSVALLGGMERMLRAVPDRDETSPWYLRRAERYYPSVRRLVAAAVLAVASIALLQVWGLHAFSWFADGSLGGRVLSAVFAMMAALLVGVLAWELANGAIERHMDRLSHDPAGGAARLARARTLTPILRVVIFSFIAAVLVLTILSEIGVNIAPLLGGAGIIGVAIGFGSQKLVQDFITGMFLLLENTMQVGDWVTLGGLSGSVEQLSIRTIRLRAGDGSLHVIPFSSVSTVTNNNRGLGNVPVSVDIAPDQDTDRVAETLKAIAAELRADPAFGRGMLSDLQYWGVDKVTTQAVTLVGQIVCTDTARYGVQREFNRRLKRRFEADGIRLAAPIQIVRIVPPPEVPGQDQPEGDRDGGPDNGRDPRSGARWSGAGPRPATPN